MPDFKDESLIKSLKEAYQASPENSKLAILLTTEYLRRARYAEALPVAQSILQREPRNVDALLSVADAKLGLGARAEAAAILEHAITLHPRHAELRVRYAQLLYEEGKFKDAGEHYLRAKELDKKILDPELEPFLNRASTKSSEQEPAEPPRLSWSGEGGEAEFTPEAPSITFADVGGMDDLKEEIRMKIIAPFEHPELFKAYGKKAGGGILLYGPPGCGKTHISRATAGEVKANFFLVGLNEILDMWIGASEKNLHRLFETARASAPAILFIDEIDALGAKRSDMRFSAGRMVINQFLTEMDQGLDRNANLLILGATNAPWSLDSAFRRPGRFDRQIFVPPPDLQARKEILCICLKDRPVKDVDTEKIVSKMKAFSGADIRGVVDRAVESVMKKAMKTGKVIEVGMSELQDAVKQTRPTVQEWMSTAKNYATYSNVSGEYDAILEYMKNH